MARLKKLGTTAYDPNDSIKCLIPVSITCLILEASKRRGCTMQAIIREACKDWTQKNKEEWA